MSAQRLMAHHSKVDLMTQDPSNQHTSQAEDASAPLTRADLEALHERLMRMEEMLEAQQKHTAQLPGLVAMCVNTADDLIARSGWEGDELEQRVSALLGLLVRASDPGLLGALSRALDDPERVIEALQSIQSLPHVIAMGANIFDEVMGQLVEQGFDLETLRKKSAPTLTALLELMQGEHVARLLDPKLLDFLSAASVALTQSLEERAQRRQHPPGVLSLLRSTRSAHVRRALDLGVHVAARLGARLGASSPLTITTAQRPLTSKEQQP